MSGSSARGRAASPVVPCRRGGTEVRRGRAGRGPLPPAEAGLSRGGNVADVELHADEQGEITFTTRVQSEVEPAFRPDDPFDCTAAPGTCALVIGAAADTQRSAYAPLTVTG